MAATCALLASCAHRAVWLPSALAHGTYVRNTPRLAYNKLMNHTPQPFALSRVKGPRADHEERSL